MTTTNYINSNGLGLKVTQLPSGTFDLYFSNGFISTCYTEEELQDLISFEKKINPNCTPGAITQQPFSEDGKSACVLSSKFVPVSGWWNDKAEVREWQERTRVYKALKELKRKGEDLKLEKAIEPLREVYARVNPSRRSIFIAQVVYLLTK